MGAGKNAFEFKPSGLKMSVAAVVPSHDPALSKKDAVMLFATTTCVVLAAICASAGKTPLLMLVFQLAVGRGDSTTDAASIACRMGGWPAASRTGASSSS